MVKPYLNQIGGNVDDDVSMFTGGLNSYQDKAFLESDQMPYVMNMAMFNPPKLCTRPSRRTLALKMENHEWASGLGDIIDIWAYDEYQFYVICSRGGIRQLVKVYRPLALGGGHSPNYTLENMISVPEEDKYYFTLAKDGTSKYLYITGLTFKIKVTIDDGNPLSSSAELKQDGYYGICCCHKGRLFLGMPGSNIVTYSALQDYENFDTTILYQVTTLGNFDNPDIVYLVEDSGNTSLWDKWVYDASTQTWGQDGTIPKTALVIDTTTGLSIPDYSVIAGDFKITNSVGNLVALKSFDDKLMVFCEHSMHCVYGDTPDPEMSNTFQLVDLNNNLGAKTDRCIAIGGGRLFWLGDNNEVYEYTGASMRMVSRPGKSRNETISAGAVSGLVEAKEVDPDGDIDLGFSHSKFIATSERLYMNIFNRKVAGSEKFLFVFDVYNRTWWCEDGAFNTICDFSQYNNRIMLAKANGDILVSDEKGGDKDEEYNFDTHKIDETPIKYEFHTRVYGADGADLRESLEKVWFQARATADVYLNDIWTSRDRWANPINPDINLVKFGTLEYEDQLATQSAHYRDNTYEQQPCYNKKMYGQRLNTFQIIVQGEGESSFYLMKRVWRAR